MDQQCSPDVPVVQSEQAEQIQQPVKRKPGRPKIVNPPQVMHARIYAEDFEILEEIRKIMGCSTPHALRVALRHYRAAQEQEVSTATA